MRIKYLSLVLVVLIGCSVLLNACTGSDENTNIETKPNTEVATNEDATKENGNGQPKKLADVIGVVQKIVGNEVTVSLIDTSEMKGMFDRDNMSDQDREAVKKQNNSGGFGGNKNGEKFEIKLTGETEVVIIPVGTPIVKRSIGEMKEMDLSSIVKGSTVMIWLEEGGNGEVSYASYVSLQAAR